MCCKFNCVKSTLQSHFSIHLWWESIFLLRSTLSVQRIKTKNKKQKQRTEQWSYGLVSSIFDDLLLPWWGKNVLLLGWKKIFLFSTRSCGLANAKPLYTHGYFLHCYLSWKSHVDLDWIHKSTSLSFEGASLVLVFTSWYICNPFPLFIYRG